LENIPKVPELQMLFLFRIVRLNKPLARHLFSYGIGLRAARTILVCHGVSGNNVYYMDPGQGGGYSIGNYNWIIADGNHYGEYFSAGAFGVGSTELPAS